MPRLMRVALAVVVATGSLHHAGAVSTGFTYQGRLELAGVPQGGACDFVFLLFDGAGGPANQVGTQVTRNATPLADGLFTVSLDFGQPAFQGADRWLEVRVKCPAGAGGAFTTLPRQPLTATPYALRANDAGDVTCTGCVSSAEIQDAGVTSADIADLSVATMDIANGAVTDAKIQSLQYAKLTALPATFPPGGVAGGHLTGSYPSPSIASGVVGSAQVTDGSLVSADVNTASIQARVVGTCAGGQAMVSINANGQVSCVPAGGITDVQAGTGLSRTAASGVVTLALNQAFTDSIYPRLNTPVDSFIRLGCSGRLQFFGDGEYIQQQCGNDAKWAISIFAGFQERMRITNDGDVIFPTIGCETGATCGPCFRAGFTTLEFCCTGPCVG